MKVYLLPRNPKFEKQDSNVMRQSWFKEMVHSPLEKLFKFTYIYVSWTQKKKKKKKDCKNEQKFIYDLIW